MIGSHGEESPRLYPAAFYGFRNWSLRTPDDGPMVLRSPHYQFEWRRPEGTASCLTTTGALQKRDDGKPHRPPEHSCGCGWYSYFAVPARETSIYWGMQIGNLVGLVLATGKIQLHETGMRSERIKVIALSPTQDDILPNLERFLQRPGWESVHVVPIEELEALAPEFGEPVPADIIEGIRQRNLAKREEERQRAEIARRKVAERAKKKAGPTADVAGFMRWVWGQ